MIRKCAFVFTLREAATFSNAHQKRLENQQELPFGQLARCPLFGPRSLNCRLVFFPPHALFSESTLKAGSFLNSYKKRKTGSDDINGVRPILSACLAWPNTGTPLLAPCTFCRYIRQTDQLHRLCRIPHGKRKKYGGVDRGALLQAFCAVRGLSEKRRKKRSLLSL